MKFAYTNNRPDVAWRYIFQTVWAEALSSSSLSQNISGKRSGYWSTETSRKPLAKKILFPSTFSFFFFFFFFFLIQS